MTVQHMTDRQRPRLRHSGTITSLRDDDAERAVLGAILLDPASITRAVVQLNADMFHGAHRDIFAAMLALGRRRETIDPLTLAAELERTGTLVAIGGKNYLGELVDVVPTSANIAHHAALVRENSLRQSVVRSAYQLAEAAADVGTPLSEAMAATTEKLAKITASSDNLRPSPFLSCAEIEKLPRREYLVDTLIPLGGVSEIHGPPGVGKSFFALGLACAVAIGHPFFGNATRRGRVVFGVGEGVLGLGSRLRAIREELGGAYLENFHVLPEPVQLLSTEHVSRFLSEIRRLDSPPVLIVLDTLARCMVGGDENSAQDMGIAMEAAARISREPGATVLLVHHTRKDGESERGSTALRGAIDAMISVKSDGGQLRIECEKMKDGPAFDSFDAMLRPVGESCVVARTLPRESTSEHLTDAHRKLLRSLASFQLSGGASSTAWKEASDGKGGAYWRHRSDLQSWGYVQLDKTGRGGRYSLTPKGEASVTPSLPGHSPLTP